MTPDQKQYITETLLSLLPRCGGDKERHIIKCLRYLKGHPIPKEPDERAHGPVERFTASDRYARAQDFRWSNPSL